MASSYTSSTMTTEFSDEHEVALSKHLERMIRSARLVEPRARVDDHRNVARPDPDRGGPAPVGLADVVLRTGDHHEVAGRHQRPRARLVHRGRQHLHEVRRGADLLELRTHQLHRAGRRREPGRRRRDDDRVPSLEGHHRLVDGGCRGVRGRRHRADHPDRLRVLDEPALRQLLDDPDALHAQEVAEGAEGLALVLDHLVGGVADPGVLDRHPGEGSGMLRLVERPRERGHRFVRPRLAHVRERRHGRAGTADEGIDDRGGVAVERFDPDFHWGFGCLAHRSRRSWDGAGSGAEWFVGRWGSVSVSSEPVHGTSRRGSASLAILSRVNRPRQIRSRP